MGLAGRKMRHTEECALLLEQQRNGDFSDTLEGRIKEVQDNIEALDVERKKLEEQDASLQSELNRLVEQLVEKAQKIDEITPPLDPKVN